MKATGSPSSFNATIRQFSEAAGIEYQEAASLTRLFVQLGTVKDTGEVILNPTGRGKGSKVYTYPQQITIDMTVPFRLTEQFPDGTS